ncbi:peptide synthetase [Paenibacillus albidus]|uniref:Peptide synthetase n=1 Tax=Paenibacillus albidus TaxID=2041023 RepID=A0A917C2R2_9BACL|nr:amino acid adenylation domain-containing protein [Paenibacillus albidus]GGF69363.1 peptide synthetase [Paenibacillus albidus]
MNLPTVENEWLQLLRGFNDTAASYSQDTTLVQQFEARAAEQPLAPAVYVKDVVYTYGELNRAANRLAHALRLSGAGSGSIVALMLERSFDMLVAVYGVLKAGAAYLPLDAECPPKRLEAMLSDSSPGWVITEGGESRPSVLPSTAEWVTLDHLADLDLPGTNLPEGPQPGDLAYVIYTSGTTGDPKGVLVEHGALVNRIEWMQKKFPITDKDILFQKTVYTFDVSVWELVWWSTAGAAVCLLPPRKENDPRVFVRLIEKTGVSVIHFVPSVLRLFLEYIGSGFALERLNSLRYVFCSGEALTAPLARQFYHTFPEEQGVKLINLYGPTEAAIDVTYHVCERDSLDEPVPIGRPIDNIRLYILRDDFSLAPIGETGQLYISGAGLARGYLNQPQLTMERFVPNPYEPGQRMYRTGDLASWNREGEVMYAGREDDQIKLRGLRIELGEVESNLLRSVHVKAAVAGVRTGDTGEQFLTAFVVAATDAEPLPEQDKLRALRAELALYLPAYAIPTEMIWIDEIPLKRTGKADRSLLLAIHGGKAARS